MSERYPLAANGLALAFALAAVLLAGSAVMWWLFGAAAVCSLIALYLDDLYRNSHG